MSEGSKVAETFTMVAHGESGTGKSWLADSLPGPRLILDVEGGVNFTPSKKVLWDPKGPPPEVGKDDTIVVQVRDLKSAQEAFTWANAGRLKVRSIGIDSLSEMQKRAVDQIAGAQQMKTQDWGALLRKMEGMVRAFRDLTMHPSNPIENVLFVCGTKVEGETGRMRPNLQGQMGTTLPYYVDVVAYLAYENGEEVGEYVRRARFQPVGNVVAKDRTNKLGSHMDEPTMPRIREAVYGGKEDA